VRGNRAKKDEGKCRILTGKKAEGAVGGKGGWSKFSSHLPCVTVAEINNAQFLPLSS
jgi:hypothetical protein